MQLLQRCSLTARTPAAPGVRRRVVVIRSAQSTSTKEPKAEAPASTKEQNTVEEIYIGFPKGDYAPREGRTGRVIKDNPKKYPAKDDLDLGPLGQLTGVAGGWAGGEAGLWQLREAVLDEQRLVSEANACVKPKVSSSDFPLPGKDPIYVGFGKDELEVKRTGVKGRVIYDQSAKYPSKEDAGFFTGVAGGFAGGERGIQAFVRDGEVSIRRPDEPPSQSISPLEATFLLLLAAGSAAAVGLQYYDPEAGFQADKLEETIESAAAYKVFGVSALHGGLTLTGVLVSLAAFRAVLSSLSSQFKDNAKRAVVYTVFGYLLFNIARGVLEF